MSTRSPVASLYAVTAPFRSHPCLRDGRLFTRPTVFRADGDLELTVSFDRRTGDLIAERDDDTVFRGPAELDRQGPRLTVSAWMGGGDDGGIALLQATATPPGLVGVLMARRGGHLLVYRSARPVDADGLLQTGHDPDRPAAWEVRANHLLRALSASSRGSQAAARRGGPEAEDRQARALQRALDADDLRASLRTSVRTGLIVAPRRQLDVLATGLAAAGLFPTERLQAALQTLDDAVVDEIDQLRRADPPIHIMAMLDRMTVPAAVSGASS